MRKIILIIQISFIVSLLHANSFVQLNEKNIILDNGYVSRSIVLDNAGIFTSAIHIATDTLSFVNKSDDFSFLLNNQMINGLSGWKLKKVQEITVQNQGSGVSITLQGNFKDAAKIEVIVYYALYPESPVIRKWIEFTNIGSDDIKIEALNIESLETELNPTKTLIYHNYARNKHLGLFVGDWDDPVVVAHDFTLKRGMALGNEAIGVLKRTAYHTRKTNIEIGLTHPGQNFPFRKWLSKNESWTCPKTFICPYSNESDGYAVVNNQVNEFIVRYMKPRVLQLKDKPTFVYNTWYPFRTFINDTLMQEVALAAAECGIEEFVIDDGWQINFQSETSKKDWGGNYGDWLVDTLKFEKGLKPTFDFIKKHNMKPGLWISIGSATIDSRVYKEHPEWFVQTQDGKLGNLHFEALKDESTFFSASFGTNWYDYIKSTILRLVNDYGLSYAKLDLAVVTSPYINNDKISGSYATDHPYHKDHNESFIVIYERLLQLFDDLHQQAPELFIDCTFETAGKLQMMDYAIAQKAEGNWLSNFEEPSPLGPLRVRQMAWWRSPALPAASLVIGNLSMDDPNFEFSLKSLIGTLPIVLGDPRKLSYEKRKQIKDWANWMKEMQNRYDYMSFRKDLPGFGEPSEGNWDGWQRINFINKTGGIFGVFKQGALETSRRVFLTDLMPNKVYTIRIAPTYKKIFSASGHELMSKGFPVKIKSNYDGNIYEIGVEE